MDTNKLFYKNLLRNLFSNACDVEFWDGEIEHYGSGDSQFKIVLKKPIPKGDIIRDPSLAFGEGYMTKKLEIEGNVETVIESIYNNEESFLHSSNKYVKLVKLISNNLKRSRENAEYHYDIGNDFYKLWLDDTMTYSCGYFKSHDDSLTMAQKNKVNHILKKLNLKAGQTILDIGCGWGELIITAAKDYNAKSLGITLSSEQYHKVKERIESEHLKDLVQVELVDYRELKNITFDKVVSVGMVEHVGKEHLHEYFSTVRRLLTEGGISILHCITGIDEGGTNTWIDKYIFPGGYIPAVKELVNHISSEGFHLIDMESLRRHYAKTLQHWAKNFENALPEIRKTKDETFIRMWRLYLNSCAASFNHGDLDIHQFLFTKGINNYLPWTREYMYN